MSTTKTKNKPLQDVNKDDTNNDQNKFYELEIDLPGFDKNEIQLNIDKGYLKIKAHKADEDAKSYYRYLTVECQKDKLSRIFKITPCREDEDINASYEDGILHIRLPQDKNILDCHLRKIDVE